MQGMSPPRIKEIPADERPRERLARAGAGALSDAELVAIFLRTGVAGCSAVELARQLLARHGGLHGMAKCTLDELMHSARGIGLAKAAELAAAFELGRRLARGVARRPRLESAKAVYELLGQELARERKEVMRVLVLNTKMELVHEDEVGIGSLNEMVAHPREIYRAAVVHGGYAVIVVHNHPSGDPQPSRADVDTTKRLAHAARVLGIHLMDHVIVGVCKDGVQGYYSFREAGHL